MSRFAKCPGLDCPAKVKINDDLPDPEINYCCIACWDYTWKMVTNEDEIEPVQGHSGGCWDRQADRFTEVVVPGEFKIRGKLPPSRLGGSGGPAL